MVYRSKFDASSLRAIRGLKFQNDVQSIIEPWFQRTWNTREWMLMHDPCLTEVQLNTLEHTWGDIVVIDTNIPYPIFIECVSLGSDNSIFPVHKIKKFNGQNKFYCFGWDSEKRFIHSSVWNCYVNKCSGFNGYKRFTRKIITNMKNQHHDADSFCEAVLKIEKHATHKIV